MKDADKEKLEVLKRTLTAQEMKEREVIENGEEIGYGLDSGETLSTLYSPSGEILEQQIEVDREN